MGTRSPKLPFGSITSAAATNKSFHPSLLRSTIPFPHPERARVAMATPDRVVISSNIAFPTFRKRGNVSLLSAVWKTSARPSLSTSPAAAPIPDTASRAVRESHGAIEG